MMLFPDLAQAIQLALKAMSMYTASHPRSAEALRALHAALATWLAERPSLQLVVSNGVIFVDGQPVEGLNLHVKALTRQFAERSIAGVVIQPGTTVEECQGFLQILLLKPAKLDEQGGVARVFDTLGLKRITLTQTQYREIREGEPDGAGGEGTGQEARPATGAGAEAPPAFGSNPLDDFSAAPLVSGWMDYLHSAVMDRGLDDLLGGAVPRMPWDPPFAGALPPADLAQLGTYAERQGWGASLPPSHQLEAFRKALMDLDGAHQLSILSGQSSLAAMPAALRISFQALAPELFASATSRLLSQGADWNGLRSALYDLLRGTPDRQTWLEALTGRLQQDGLGFERVEDLVRQMNWDGQPVETQIRQVEDPRLFWELTLEQRLAFLRRLLEQGRTETFLALLDHLILRLSSEQPGPREAALRTLAGITDWLCDACFPHEAEGPLLDGLKTHFAWEPLPPLLDLTTTALGTLLACLLRRKELGPVSELLREMRGLLEVLGEGREDLPPAFERMLSLLCAESPMDGAFEVLHGMEPAQIHLEAIPFFEFLEHPGATALMERLASEPDRRRRGRLMEVMRGLGEAAVPALRNALTHPSWFVVRNALNLLSELGHAGLLEDVAQCLRHRDPRVRQAAVRALWKLGGPTSDGPLLELLPVTDPDTQLEILFGLGQIQSPRAAAALQPFASDARVSERLRIKAIEVLGLLGRPESLGTLTELLRRKGRIFTSAEPLPVRLAAAKALLALNSTPARTALQEIVASEPRGADREALQSLIQGSGR